MNKAGRVERRRHAIPGVPVLEEAVEQENGAAAIAPFQEMMEQAVGDDEAVGGHGLSI